MEYNSHLFLLIDIERIPLKKLCDILYWELDNFRSLRYGHEVLLEQRNILNNQIIMFACSFTSSPLLWIERNPEPKNKKVQHNSNSTYINILVQDIIYLIIANASAETEKWKSIGEIDSFSHEWSTLVHYVLLERLTYFIVLKIAGFIKSSNGSVSWSHQYHYHTTVTDLCVKTVGKSNRNLFPGSVR